MFATSGVGGTAPESARLPAAATASERPAVAARQRAWACRGRCDTR